MVPITDYVDLRKTISDVDVLGTHDLVRYLAEDVVFQFGNKGPRRARRIRHRSRRGGEHPERQEASAAHGGSGAANPAPPCCCSTKRPARPTPGPSRSSSEP